MAERRPKPEEGFMMRNTSTGKVEALDAATAQLGMTTRAIGSALPLYVPQGPVPGFTFRDDGGVVATTFDPDTAISVAQNQGKKGFPHRLAFGKNDPGFAAAKAYREDQVLRQVGKNRGFGRVFAERLASVVTFGASSALKDENEEQAQARAYQNLYHPFASLTGTFGGIGVGLLFPFGTMAGALGKGAMAAGKASGAARAVQTAQLASGAKPVTNLLGLSAKAGKAARAGLEPAGAFVQNYGGGLVTAAVADAPIALAIAAADIADYNKDFSAQALVQDAGSLWLTGVGITAAIGLPAAALTTGAGKAAAAIEGRRAAKETFTQRAGREAIALAESVGTRVSHRGRTPVVGAAQAQVLRRGLQWVRKGMKSRAATKLTGEAVEAAEATSQTIRQTATALSASGSVDNLVNTARVLRPAAATNHVATMLDDVIENAPKIVTASDSYNIAARQFKDYSASWQRWLPKLPTKINFKTGGGAAAAKARLSALHANVLSQSKLGGAFAAEEAALAAKLGTIVKQMDKSTNRQALGKLFEAHKAAMQSGTTGVGKYEQIRLAVSDMTSGDPRVMRILNDFDEFSKAKGELDMIFGKIPSGNEWTLGTVEAKEIGSKFAAMQRTADDLGFDALTQRNLIKDAEVMARDVTVDGLDKLAQVNLARRAILENEGVGFGSVLKSPIGPEGALTYSDELLDMQVQTIMGFKKQTASALRLLTAVQRAQNAATFGGVLTYRAMTEEVKRANFEGAREIILETTASSERLIEAVGQTAGIPSTNGIELGVAYASTLMTANSYLLQQMPKSSDPLIGPSDFSMQEIDSFLETLGALESPASVLASGHDGSVSIEGVDAIRTVYPELYTDMLLDLIEFKETPEWDKLNEAQRIGMDTFTGGALGILQSFGPMPGPLFAQTPMQQEALGFNRQQSSPQMARLQSKLNSTASQKVGAV